MPKSPDFYTPGHAIYLNRIETKSIRKIYTNSRQEAGPCVPTGGRNQEERPGAGKDGWKPDAGHKPHKSCDLRAPRGPANRAPYERRADTISSSGCFSSIGRSIDCQPEVPPKTTVKSTHRCALRILAAIMDLFPLPQKIYTG